MIPSEWNGILRMMSLRSRLALLVVVAIAVPCLACGGNPPDREIQQARDAVESARGAGAAQYAGEELAAAERALNDAGLAVEDRDYRLALNHALDSREHAQTAAGLATESKATAKASADRALAQATESLERARTTLKASEAAHAQARLLADARAALDDAERDLQEARTQVERGMFAAAEKTSRGAIERLETGVTALESATPAPTRKRR